MSEWLRTVPMLLAVLSPLLVPVACFLVQIFLCVKKPPVLLILPLLSGAAVFGWFPSHWNEAARVLYVLDLMGAFIGSLLGAGLSAAVYWKTWFKRR